MKSSEPVIKKYWPQIVAVVAVIVWLIRLEGKLDFVEKTQDTEGKRMVDAMKDIVSTQKDMNIMISKIEVTLAGIVSYEKGISEARKRR